MPNIWKNEIVRDSTQQFVDGQTRSLTPIYGHSKAGLLEVPDHASNTYNWFRIAKAPYGGAEGGGGRVGGHIRFSVTGGGSSPGWYDIFATKTWGGSGQYASLHVIGGGTAMVGTRLVYIRLSIVDSDGDGSYDDAFIDVCMACTANEPYVANYWATSIIEPKAGKYYNWIIGKPQNTVYHTTYAAGSSNTGINSPYAHTTWVVSPGSSNPVSLGAATLPYAAGSTHYYTGFTGGSQTLLADFT